MRATTTFGTFVLLARAISGKGITDVAGRQAVAIAGVESHFNDNVTRAYLDRLYPGYTEEQAATSFSFRNAGIALAGYYYVQGSTDVQEAIDNCGNDGSASGTLTCMNKVLTAMVGTGMALVGGGTSGGTVTEMISHVSRVAIGLPDPGSKKRYAVERRGPTCPAAGLIHDWDTPGNVDFNNGWATTATVVLACPSVRWSSSQQAAAEGLASSLGTDMEFVGGSHVQFTYYIESSDSAMIRSNLVVINGGNLCTGDVTGGRGCRF